jgi:two-component system response regulator HydG
MNCKSNADRDRRPVTSTVPVPDLAPFAEPGSSTRNDARRLAAQEHLVAGSRAMREVIARIRLVAPTDTSVLLHGETGTGKERVARLLHALSNRAEAPFTAINCGAIAETLLESELFGHERGAFTDARTARRGLLLETAGGTLFLDEIGDMPMAMQVKLLRALDTRCVRPIGGAHELPFDCRIVAATHRNLAECVEAGLFREDLYYRVAVFPVVLPPLRARLEDVLPLADLFLAEAAGRAGRATPRLDPIAAERLLNHRWPGNIRELRNAIDHALVLADADVVLAGHLPPGLDGTCSGIGHEGPRPHASDTSKPTETLAANEHAAILRTVHECRGNLAAAARKLGIGRRTLYRKLDSATLARIRLGGKRGDEVDH